eukprot:160927_1
MQMSSAMKCYGFQKNYLLAKRIVKDKKMFCQLFTYYTKQLIMSNNNKALRATVIEDFGRCVHYKLLTITKYLKKNKYVRWILKYCYRALVSLLQNCCQTVLNIPLNTLIGAYISGQKYDVFMSISFSVDLIMNRMKQYDIGLYYELIDKHCFGHKTAFDYIPYHGMGSYVDVMVNFHHEEIHKGRMECGNMKCRKKYLIHKYGDKALGFSQKRTDYFYFKNGVQKWKTLKVLNRWYICKGCKVMFYCCRKCQKISW